MDGLNAGQSTSRSNLGSFGAILSPASNLQCQFDFDPDTFS